MRWRELTVFFLAFGSITASPNEDLHLAAENGDVEGIKSAIASGAKINAFVSLPMEPENLVGCYLGGLQYRMRRTTAIFRAALCGHANAVQALIEAKADLKLITEGRGVLHWAIPHAEVAEVLLTAGADPNVPDSLGYTPLIANASSHADPEFARVLIRFKANVNSKDKKCGTTAIWHAVASEKLELAEVLMKAGAKTKIVNRCDKSGSGKTAWQIAAKRGNSEMIQILKGKPDSP